MSSAFRISQRSINTTVMSGLQGNLDRMQRLQERLSSGRLLNRPSDSPVDTGAALRYRSDIRRAEQHSRNAQDGIGWLDTADKALSETTSYIRRAQTLILEGTNAASGPAARKALAAEVDSIREGIIGLANTSYLNRPIFAGTKATTVAYDAAGKYVGDGGVVERRVANDVTIPVSLDGRRVFGDDAGGLLALLSDAADKLRSGDTASLANVELAALDDALHGVLDHLATVGARYNRLETMRDRADAAVQTLRNGLVEVEDIDLPKTIVDLQMQEMAYKAALSATARVIQPSLVDFLR